MYTGSFIVETKRHMELIDITHEISSHLKKSAIHNGICFIFNPHTTSGLTLNEGADPDVQRDIIAALQQMVPGNVLFHHAEGNSLAHILTSLFGSSLTVFIEDNHLLLGTWQKVFLGEFDGPRSRTVYLRLLAE